MKRHSIKLAALVGLAGLTVSAPALAGGPLANCNSGQSFLWPNGGSDIKFNPDQGNLGPVPGPSAVALVDSAFQAWEDIPSSTLSYSPGASLPVDVDITNFGPYFDAPAPDGLSAVVFDDTGEIFDLLFGSGTGVLGFAGPEWGNTITCDIDESLSFLNGPSFTNATAALDVMVHEFGHWTNFAHTVVNGQIYLGSIGGDNTGPTPNNTFGAPPDPFSDVVETMYPFYYGPGIGTQTLEADDIAIASRMYPEPDYASTTGTISGEIRFGANRVTGVNVIARNVADPFKDAVSAISSDFTDATSQGDPNVGVYAITGLTPGADYAVYVDEVLAGGFSTALASPLPGPEEFFNGQNESGDPTVDDPSEFTPVTVAAGAPVTGTDILFNLPSPGDPLPVGDDGTVELPLPFTFCLQGQAFGTVFVNSNGNLTFGAGSTDFSESESDFRNGPARVAAVWDDLNPSAGGSVFYNQTSDSFTVTYDSIPEFFATGSNTFSITLYDNSSQCVARGGDDDDSDSDSDDDRSRSADIVVDYTAITATDGIAGVTGGLAVTGGDEAEVDLSNISRDGRRKIRLDRSAAVFERFEGEFFGDANDLGGVRLKYNKVGRAFRDRFEPNDSLEKASAVGVPFDTTDTKRHYSSIDPAAADIDFYRFHANAGETLIAQVTRGQIDSVLGLWYCPPDMSSNDDDDSDSDSDNDDDDGRKLDRCSADTAVFIGFNDDILSGSNPLLSGLLFPIPATGTWAVAVTFCCDYDFDGVDPGQGAPFDGGRYVLDLQLIDGVPINLGDDDSLGVTMGFSFPFNGVDYDDVFINSNGNLTFGSPDFDFSESVSELLSDQPRIAPLWDDLSPNQGGLVIVKSEADEFKVTFQDVPEFLATTGNTFSVTLRPDGSINFEYGSLAASDGIVGVTEGGGAADPGETDLSANPNQSATGTTYEAFLFGEENDLDDASLDFQ